MLKCIRYQFGMLKGWSGLMANLHIFLLVSNYISPFWLLLLEKLFSSDLFKITLNTLA